MDHFEKALDAGYDDVDIYKKLGYLEKDLGRPAKAREAFKTYLSEAGDDLSTSVKKEVVEQIRELGGELP